MDWKESLIREIFEKRCPTVLLGSGASIATGRSLNLKSDFPSMADLAKRFVEEIDPTDFVDDDAVAWESLNASFRSLGEKWWQFNLERFLTDHPLRADSPLLQAMRTQTCRAFEAPHKAVAEVFEADQTKTYPLRAILERLLRAAPVNNPELYVITPNYDLLVEYTADLLGVPCLTGFTGTILRQWKPELGVAPVHLLHDGKLQPARRIRLIKPHGSYSWQYSPTSGGRIIEHFALRELAGDWQSCIIAPGPSKYAESLKDVRREHMRFMDEAFRRAQSLLVLGYGFNDPHLEACLKESLARGTPAIIVTKELGDDAIRNYVLPHPMVTCITTDGSSGCTVRQGTNKTDYSSQCLWKLDEFLHTFML